jgi:hypothetical protein
MPNAAGPALLGVALALMAFLTAAAPSSALADSPPAGRVACGAPGKPPCPLQAWMRGNVAAPLALGDLTKLAHSLEALRAMSPDPRWTNWQRFAGDGARAARDGDAAKAQQSCTRCHEVYRARYNELYRGRAAPAAR